MAEVVERNCHVQVGGHAAEWAIHDDHSWHATYGPFSENGEEKSAASARRAASAWVGTIHKAHTGTHLPE